MQTLDGRCRSMQDKRMENTTPPTLISSLSELSHLSRKPKLVTFTFGEERVSIEVRALTQVEWMEVTAIGADLQPPPKYKDDKKTPDGYNYEDPEYVRKAKEIYALRMAAAIDLVWKARGGIPVERGSLEDKAKWLDENLPPSLTELLYNSIRTLTTDATQLASFSSADA